MSTLAENVAKVTAAHAALKEAIAAKGVAVPDGTKLSEMPALVDRIETPPVPTNQRAVFAHDTFATSLTVPSVLVVDMKECDSLYYCFYGCGSLTSLTLPAGFGSVATGLGSCFYGCGSLTSLTLPAGFGSVAKSLSDCFYGCGSLTSLTLPAGFGSVATGLGSCFYGCGSLTSLTLPAGFGSVAKSLSYCFRGCGSLTSLTLPAGFGSEADSLSSCFYGCTALTTIMGEPNFKANVVLSESTKLTHDSIMVIINGLQTATARRVLTLGATNLAKLTNEDKAVATDKGWTLA